MTSRTPIGVLGSGDVGKRLAGAFATLGHPVRMGTREPSRDDVQTWVKEQGGDVKAVPLDEAARFGDIVVLATGWSGTENALRLAGADNLRGKLVIDATNPLRHTDEGPELALGHTDSGGEQVQRWIADSRVVKCFNIVGNPHMFRPEFPGGPPDMFICGNDADAKKTVESILRDFGWSSTIDIGGIEGARLLEPMAMLWVAYGITQDNWDIAWKMLAK